MSYSSFANEMDDLFLDEDLFLEFQKTDFESVWADFRYDSNDSFLFEQPRGVIDITGNDQETERTICSPDGAMTGSKCIHSGGGLDVMGVAIRSALLADVELGLDPTTNEIKPGKDRKDAISHKSSSELNIEPNNEYSNSNQHHFSKDESLEALKSGLIQSSSIKTPSLENAFLDENDNYSSIMPTQITLLKDPGQPGRVLDGRLLGEPTIKSAIDETKSDASTSMYILDKKEERINNKKNAIDPFVDEFFKANQFIQEEVNIKFNSRYVNNILINDISSQVGVVNNKLYESDILKDQGSFQNITRTIQESKEVKAKQNQLQHQPTFQVGSLHKTDYNIANDQTVTSSIIGEYNATLYNHRSPRSTIYYSSSEEEDDHEENNKEDTKVPQKRYFDNKEESLVDFIDQTNYNHSNMNLQQQTFYNKLENVGCSQSLNISKNSNTVSNNTIQDTAIYFQNNQMYMNEQHLNYATTMIPEKRLREESFPSSVAVMRNSQSPAKRRCLSNLDDRKDNRKPLISIIKIVENPNKGNIGVSRDVISSDYGLVLELIDNENGDQVFKSTTETITFNKHVIEHEKPPKPNLGNNLQIVQGIKNNQKDNQKTSKSSKSQKFLNGKIKLYTENPLTDPNAEKARLNAINAKKNRDRKKLEMEKISEQISSLTQENNKLKRSTEEMERRATAAEFELQRLREIIAQNNLHDIIKASEPEE